MLILPRWAPKLANPDKKVVCVAGDGGFHVFGARNGRCGPAGHCCCLHRIRQRRLHEREDDSGSPVWRPEYCYGSSGTPDFVAFAESFGITAERATTPDELEEALTRLFGGGRTGADPCSDW